MDGPAGRVVGGEVVACRVGGGGCGGGGVGAAAAGGAVAVVGGGAWVGGEVLGDFVAEVVGDDGEECGEVGGVGVRVTGPPARGGVGYTWPYTDLAAPAFTWRTPTGPPGRTWAGHLGVRPKG